MNKVDVIIPVHGKPIYFAETLQSIMNQPQVKNIIVILDRVDKEYFAALEIPKHKTKVFNSKIPGIVSALNLGLEKSNADFIARIDSDDIMFPGRISTQLDFLMSNPDHVCVGSSLEIFGAGMKKKIKKYPSQHKKIVKHLTYQNAIAHPSVMYRKDSVLAVGGYRRIFEGAEDYDLWFRLSKIGKLYNLKQPLTRYRINSEQYSLKFSPYRSELDSLVRLFNLGFVKVIPKISLNTPATKDQIQEYLRIYSKQMQMEQPKLSNQLLCAQRFGDILNTKSSQRSSVAINFKVLFLIFKLIATSPLFSLKVINGKIFK
jgi:glycosyltransferase involved in cell wall biosynthesis